MALDRLYFRAVIMIIAPITAELKETTTEENN